MFRTDEKVIYQQLFDISEASASRDQAGFQGSFESLHQKEIFRKHADGRLVGGRLSLVDDVELSPNILFSSMPPIDRWLEAMFGQSRFEQISLIRTDPHQHVLRVIVRGIEDHQMLSIAYHSRRAESTRKISAHAIIKVAGRYHLRAYDHATNDYRDFVLARILNARQLESDHGRYVGPDLDEDWHRHVEVMVQAKIDGAGRTPHGVCLDFGLDKRGQKRFSVRKALAPYLIDNIKSGFSQPVEVMEA